MKILYFHGLDGELSPEKNAILSEYGDVTGPHINYRADANIIQTFQTQYSNQGFDVIIGNSMGGFAAYYLSILFNVPALIFNPALPYRSVAQTIPEIKQTRSKFLQVVIGQQDEIIKAEDTLRFLQNALAPKCHSRIHMLNTMAHRVPEDVFAKEVSLFFEELQLE